MEKRKRWAIHLFIDEGGQATTEYLLLLSITVSLLMTVIKVFIKPTFTKLMSAVENNIQNKLFGADLYTFRIRR
jgi:hypothetical protein